MSQTQTFMDCRGLSAPLTLLRIKQALTGRATTGLPLDVVVDRRCGDGARIAQSLNGAAADVRLLHVAEAPAPAWPAATPAESGRRPHA